MPIELDRDFKSISALVEAELLDLGRGEEGLAVFFPDDGLLRLIAQTGSNPSPRDPSFMDRVRWVAAKEESGRWSVKAMDPQTRQSIIKALAGEG